MPRMLAVFVTALCLVAVSVAQTPPVVPGPADGPPGRPPPAARPAARQSLTERLGDGQLIEADDTHVVLRVPVDPNRPDGDTRDVRIDVREGEPLRLTVDGEPAKVADLKLPMAADVTRYRGTGRPWPALQARLGVNVRTPGVTGTITAVTPPTLTMTVGRDRTPLTVTTDEKTRFIVFAPVPGSPGIRPGRTGTLDDLKPGMLADVHPPGAVATLVSAHVPITDGELAATRPLNDERDVGLVVKIDGNTLHLLSNQRGAVTFETDGRTRITLDRRVVTLAELRPEMEVIVSRRTNALRPGEPTLRITATSQPVLGVITKVDGDTLTIAQRHEFTPPSDLTVALDDTVKIETFPDYPENAKPGTRADLIVGREAAFVNHDGKLATIRVFTGTPATRPATTRPAE